MATPKHPKGDTVTKAAPEAQDIYTQASLSNKLFSTYIGSERVFGKQVKECQQRFLTWASFFGVFANDSLCLDNRLQHSPEVKSLVLSMLWILNRNLQRGISLHVPNKPRKALECNSCAEIRGDAAMYGIDGAIDRLHRLTVAIQDLSKSDEVEEVKRVRNFASKRKPDGFHGVISAVVQFLFSGAEKTLQTQLVESIVYRRHRLLWRRGHSPELRQERKEKGIYHRQETGTEESSNPHPQVAYPDRPRSSNEAKIICKYCLEEIDMPPQGTKEEKDARWRQHLDTDLRPYTCMSEACSRFPTCFSTLTQWKTHMFEKHGTDWIRYIHRIKWHCQYCTDQNVYFWTQDSLICHITNDKPETHLAGEGQLELARITAKSKTGDLRSEFECPLCSPRPTNEPVSSDPKSSIPIENINDLYQHLGSHLMQLALLSLSWWDDDVGDQSTATDNEAASENVTVFNSKSENMADKNIVSREPAYIVDLGDEEVKSHFLQLQQLEKDFQTSYDQFLTDQEIIRDKLHGGIREDSWNQLAMLRAHFESGDMEGEDEVIERLQYYRQYILERADYMYPRKERYSEITAEVLELPYELPGSDDASLEWSAIRYNRLSNQVRAALRAISDGQDKHTPTEPSLRHRLIESFVEGFSTNQDAMFLPEGILHQVIMPDAVVRELQEMDPSSLVDLNIFDGILNASKRIFGILCYLGYTGKNLSSIMQLLSILKVNDKALPAIRYDISQWFERTRAADSHHLKVQWQTNTTDRFYTAQWKFLAPVILSSISSNSQLTYSHILPVSFEHKIATAGVSLRAVLARIPRSHVNSILPTLGSCLSKSENTLQRIAVRGVWRVEIGEPSEEWDVDQQSALEVHALRDLSRIHHENVVKCFEPLHVMMDHYFLFDLDGYYGTLNEFWIMSTSQSGLKSTFVKETLLQLRGVADALCVFHKSGHSHGGLNPQNIHIFRGNHDVGIGTMKISTMDITRRPHIPSESSMGRRDEVYVSYDENSNDHASYASDMWSFGCIILEGLIFLLHGYQELLNFRIELASYRYTRAAFSSSTNRLGVHRLVTSWMNHMANNPACSEDTVLGALLEIVRTRLLIKREHVVAVSRLERETLPRFLEFPSDDSPPFASRATSFELLHALDEIVAKTEDGSCVCLEENQTAIHRFNYIGYRKYDSYGEPLYHSGDLTPSKEDSLAGSILLVSSECDNESASGGGENINLNWRDWLAIARNVLFPWYPWVFG